MGLRDALTDCSDSGDLERDLARVGESRRESARATHEYERLHRQKLKDVTGFIVGLMPAIFTLKREHPRSRPVAASLQ